MPPDEAPAAAPATPANFSEQVGSFGGEAAPPTPGVVQPPPEGVAPPPDPNISPGAVPPDMVAAPEGTEDLIDPDAPPPVPEFEEPAEPEIPELFGMAHADLIEALSTGEGVVPENLLEHLKVSVKRDGVEETIPLSEYRDGVMMRSDYSRKLDTLRGERQEFDGMRNSFSGMVEGWKKNPETMGDDLEMMNIDLEKVLMPIAQWYAEMEQMTPREQDFAKRARNAERRERMGQLKVRAENKRLSAGREDAQQQQVRETVASYRGPALKQAGVEEGPTAERIFNDHLRNLWQEGDLTPQHAQHAAQATKQDLIALARAYNAAPASPPGEVPGAVPVAAPGAAPPRPPPARGAAPGTVRPAAAGRTAQQSGTRADFENHLERLRERDHRR